MPGMHRCTTAFLRSSEVECHKMMCRNCETRFCFKCLLAEFKFIKVRFIDSSLCGSKATEEGERIMTEDRFRVSVNSQCHARRPCGGRYVVNS